MKYGISKRTLMYWLAKDGITRHRFGDGYTAIRWGDITEAATHSPRWREPAQHPKEKKQ